MSFLAVELIKKKRNKGAHTEEEIEFLIKQYTAGQIADYQMSSWLMATFLNGMQESETLALTKSMLNSGDVVSFSHLADFKVDKHSTGGVGDKTSLILGPIVAAAGLKVPMISGRGLGHTGGTLDKLESIPGFNTQISIEHFKNMVADIGISFIGQTLNICPADKKIYALRDVTATVESLPLICASIMSKKLAEGIDGLVLDVKFGSGAFMKTETQATELAKALMAIAKGYGKKVVALITDMDRPLGRYAGNAFEVFECLEIMKGEKDKYADTRELSLQLSAHMMNLSGQYSSLEHAYQQAVEILDSGKALKKFRELCTAHSGDIDKINLSPKFSKEIKSSGSGFIKSMDTEQIGLAGIVIRAGRKVSADLIDPVAGIEFYKKTGDPVKANETVYRVFGSNESEVEQAAARLESSYSVTEVEPITSNLIRQVLY